MAQPTLTPLPDTLITTLVEIALAEDLGDAGDITSNATVKEHAIAHVRFVARQPGTIAGLALAKTAFRLMDPEIQVSLHIKDGDRVKPGDVIADVKGSARAILTAERVALNYLGHLSGIATATARIVDAVSDYKARICCTRKTTPGLRTLEKYAVRAGGGVNHRFGLYDGILIKDNHIAIAGGIEPAIKGALSHTSHMARVEVEVDTLDQLDEVLTYPIHAVLLDNMTPEQLSEAVKRIDGRIVAEASGMVTVDTAPAIAATGVDLISVGGITHSAACLDIGLDFV
jgi:nicotinate-nucleotide pyrophosphorylase (carboxylating)